MEISFVLREDLQKLDSQGIGYVYKATQHPSAYDLMIIHFEEDGGWTTANYTKEVFEENFKNGGWIKVESNWKVGNCKR